MPVLTSETSFSPSPPHHVTSPPSCVIKRLRGEGIDVAMETGRNLETSLDVSRHQTQAIRGVSDIPVAKDRPSPAHKGW